MYIGVERTRMGYNGIKAGIEPLGRKSGFSSGLRGGEHGFSTTIN